MTSNEMHFTLIFYFLTVFILSVYGYHVTNKSEAYVSAGEKDEDFESVTTRNTFTHVYTTYSNGYQGDQTLCPGRTSCTILSECRLLTDLMDKTCLLPTRLRELTCGYVRNEPMVCCPPGGNSSPFRPGDRNEETPGKPGLNQNCGRPQLNGWQSGYSGLGSQPWAVRIGFKNSVSGYMEYPCCGSVITSKVVLTAAHCALLKQSGRTLTSVRIGEYDARADPDCTNTFCGHPVQNIPVSHVVVHPGYERSTFRHDVALIILKESANFSLSAQPICLLRDRDFPVIGRRAKLVGWGKIPGEDTVPPRQHQLDLPIVSPDTCNRLYSQVIPITQNHLCVGGEAQKDACSGFGGAPLVLIDHVRNDRYYQVGMTSFGSDKCGAAGVPSVYTNIAEYNSWITSNVP